MQDWAIENAERLTQLGLLALTLLAALFAWRERHRARLERTKTEAEAKRARDASQEALVWLQQLQEEKLEWERRRDREAQVERVRSFVHAFMYIDSDRSEGVVRAQEAGVAMLQSEEEFDEAVLLLVKNGRDLLGDHERFLEGLDRLAVLKEYWELQSDGKSVPELYTFLNAKRADHGLEPLRPK